MSGSVVVDTLVLRAWTEWEDHEVQAVGAVDLESLVYNTHGRPGPAPREASVIVTRPRTWYNTNAQRGGRARTTLSIQVVYIIGDRRRGGGEVISVPYTVYYSPTGLGLEPINYIRRNPFSYRLKLVLGFQYKEMSPRNWHQHYQTLQPESV